MEKSRRGFTEQPRRQRTREHETLDCGSVAGRRLGRFACWYCSGTGGQAYGVGQGLDAKSRCYGERNKRHARHHGDPDPVGKRAARHDRGAGHDDRAADDDARSSACRNNEPGADFERARSGEHGSRGHGRLDVRRAPTRPRTTSG